MNLEIIAKYVDLIVKYVPTLIFILIVLVSTLTGFIRGFRKSLILAIQAFCAAAISIALFFVCTKVEAVDKFFLFVIDYFMGGQGSLAANFGVTQEVDTLKEVITYAIPNMISFDETVNFMLTDNVNYLATLVDVIFNLVFAIVCVVIYELLVGLLCIIYHIFYSERKYKKKRKKDFADSKVDSTYKKKRLLGSLIGFSRGLIAGCISLSIIGNLLFVIVGPGNGEAEELDLGNEDANYVYDIYQSVESYGTTGIYKVLNTFTDSKEQPYYLFALDVIFSGRLQDEDLGIDETIRFNDELEAYTAFVRNTANLLFKYGGEEISNIIANGGVTEDTMNFALDVMKNPDFQNEFEKMIIDFDSKTYIINFAFSFVDSFIANIDSLGLGEVPTEMISILFKKGHLSNAIPDEREMKLARKQNSENEEEKEEVLPYIHVGHLLKKQDVLAVFDIVKTVIEINNTPLPEDVVTPEDEYINLAKNIIPHLGKLSILDSRRKDELDPVLGRLYCYIENEFLTLDGKDGITYKEIQEDNISWIGELNSLLTVAGDILDLYKNVAPYLNDPNEVIKAIFDPNHEGYEENQVAYGSVRKAVSNSKLLGKVLSSNLVVETIIDAMSSSFGDTYIPRYIQFENTYDEKGNIVSYGEIHLLFGGIEILGKPENYEILIKMIQPGFTPDGEFLESLVSILDSQDQFGMTLIDYLSESNLLRSIVSSALISFSNNDAMPLYVPDTVKEKDEEGNSLPLIDKKSFKATLGALKQMVDIVLPFIVNPPSTQKAMLEEMEKIMKNEDTLDLLNQHNHIIEGSIAKLLITYLGNVEIVKIPVSLQSPDGWLTANNQGELSSIVNFIFSAEISLLDFLSMDEGTNPVDKLKDLTAKDVERLFESKVLHYTISNLIEDTGDIAAGDFKILIPKSAKMVLKDDVIDSVIRKEQLISVFTVLLELDFNNLNDPSGMFSQLINHKDAIVTNDIVSSSIVNFLVNNESTKEMLFKNAAEDDKYVVAAKPKNLEDYTLDNPWRQELVYLIDSLDEIFGISKGETVDFSQEGLENKIEELMSTINDTSFISPNYSRLTVCCRSRIVRGLMTETLDNAFSSLVSPEVLKKAKADEGCYTLKELEALASCLDILNIKDGEFGSIDPNDITGIVLTLNDEYKNDMTRLDAMYGSIIIQHIVSDRLDEALSNGLVDENILSSIKNKGVYPKNEVASILDGIIALCGSNVSSLEDLNDVKFDLQSINKNIDKIVESAIIRSIVSVKIDESIVNEDKFTQELADVLKEKDGKKPLYYSKEEISCLVHALNEILTTESNPNPDFEDIGNMDFTIDTIKENLDVIVESSIVRAIVSAELDNIIVTSGYEIKQFSSLKEYTLSDRTKVVYRKVELQSFFVALEELLTDSEDSNKLNVNPDSILSIDENTFTNKVYASNILAIIISNELDKVLTEDLIDQNVISKLKVNNRYEVKEISRMINSLKLLSDDPDNFSFADISDMNLTDDLTNLKEKLPQIYESDIMAGIITKQINKTLTGGVIKDHPYAYRSNDLKIYRKEEIESLLALTDGGLSFTMEMLDEKLPLISQMIYDEEGKTTSYLLVATFSDKVMNGVDFLVIPQKATEKGHIKAEELSKLLDALEALNIDLSGDNGNDVLNTIPDEEAYEEIFASTILRASITSLIKISDQDSDITTLYVAKESYDPITETTEKVATVGKNIKNGKSILILSSSELERIFDILHCCSKDGKLEIPSIKGIAGVIEFIGIISGADGTTLDEIYKCSVFRHLISDILDANLNDTIKSLLKFKGIEIEYSTESVYKLSPSQSTTATNKNYIKLSSIKDIFDVYEEFN